MAAKDPYLIPSANGARYGDGRPHRRLFLPDYLRGEAEDMRLRGARQDAAYQLILKWADLEASGKLQRRKETALQGEFLTEVFGEALGYTLFSAGLAEWHLEAQFPISGGTADAAIGLFTSAARRPFAMVELKGPTANIDRDRFGGRTAVQQCWDYLNAVPECPWGIVCNYVSFRLYHRDHTPRAFEHFALQDLRRQDEFRRFYCLFERGGLVPPGAGRRSRADLLLERTAQKQRQVGDLLYAQYHENRIGLIRHLEGPPHRKTREQAIHIAQKLLDRIIFVAFCEDRGLLPAKSLRKAHEQLPPYRRVTNPRWQNFRDLFRSIDEGNLLANIDRYDGGLFANDPAVDDLELDDDYTDFFKEIGEYDFRDEVNVDVLGHLFERSVGDLERIRTQVFFEAETDPDTRPRMPKSAERKRFGIFYTPPELTAFIVQNTVGLRIQERREALSKQHAVDPADGARNPDPKHAAFWRACLSDLRDLRIVDPACGSGAFLIRAYECLEEKYQEVIDQLVFHEGPKAEALRDEVPDYILRDNLFGVDLSPQAVEITQLALWIRSARRGKTLADLSHNIVCGNSLVSDAAVDPRAMDWPSTFPQVFSREASGFDCVIGNPPWERLKLQEREFFEAAAPQIAAAVNAATRRRLIEQLKEGKPELHQRYLAAKTAAEQTLNYVRTCGRYPLTGKGDINTYAVFAELARTVVAPTGRVGLLVPSGIATDNTTRQFFGALTDRSALAALYDFENRKKLFPDVDGRFKFCVLLFGGGERRFEAADFVFFAHTMDDLKPRDRHIALTAADFKLLNPNTRTCPIFRTRRDAELTKAIYQRVPVLIDKNRRDGGNPWGVRFMRMFDQTNDAELFHTAEQLAAAAFKRDGAVWRKRKKVFLPLYEAKMIQMYDHRAASVVVRDENWMRQGQTDATSLVQHQNPEYAAEPRWWVDQESVLSQLGDGSERVLLAYKDVTSATNQRTMIAAFIPLAGVVNSAPLVLTGENIDERRAACLLANVNSFAFDFVARQKVGGVHLNFFIVEQLPVFPPDFYDRKCPWEERQTLEEWISDRVLKLTCTANDMRPLAEAAGFDPPVYRWDPAERAELMAELDAAYFLLYGLNRDDTAYVLSTFSGVDRDEGAVLGLDSPADRILRSYDRLTGHADRP